MAYSDNSGNRIDVYSLGIAPAVSLTNVSAVGAGDVLDGLTVRSAAVIAVTAGAGVTAGSVQLQGSVDGANWFSLGSAVSTTTASTTTQTVVSSAYARYVRAAVTTAITGGTVSASVGVSG